MPLVVISSAVWQFLIYNFNELCILAGSNAKYNAPSLESNDH